MFLKKADKSVNSSFCSSGADIDVLLPSLHWLYESGRSSSSAALPGLLVDGGANVGRATARWIASFGDSFGRQMAQNPAVAPCVVCSGATAAQRQVPGLKEVPSVLVVAIEPSDTNFELLTKHAKVGGQILLGAQMGKKEDTNFRIMLVITCSNLMFIWHFYHVLSSYLSCFAKTYFVKRRWHQGAWLGGWSFSSTEGSDLDLYGSKADVPLFGHGAYPKHKKIPKVIGINQNQAQKHIKRSMLHVSQRPASTRRHLLVEAALGGEAGRGHLAVTEHFAIDEVATLLWDAEDTRRKQPVEILTLTEVVQHAMRAFPLEGADAIFLLKLVGEGSQLWFHSWRLKITFP